VNLNFGDRDHAALTFTVKGSTGTKAITRQFF